MSAASYILDRPSAQKTEGFGTLSKRIALLHAHDQVLSFIVDRATNRILKVLWKLALCKA
jgi:hypothetical protein